MMLMDQQQFDIPYSLDLNLITLVDTLQFVV